MHGWLSRIIIFDPVTNFVVNGFVDENNINWFSVYDALIYTRVHEATDTYARRSKNSANLFRHLKSIAWLELEPHVKQITINRAGRRTDLTWCSDLTGLVKLHALAGAKIAPDKQKLLFDSLNPVIDRQLMSYVDNMDELNEKELKKRNEKMRAMGLAQDDAGSEAEDEDIEEKPTGSAGGEAGPAVVISNARPASGSKRAFDLFDEYTTRMAAIDPDWKRDEQALKKAKSFLLSVELD